LNTVVIKSVDRGKVTQAVYQLAQQLSQNHPEIIRMIWFGSWINGIPSPGSDVDLCVIVTNIDIPPRDRVSLYLPVGFPVGIDLLVFTQAEFEALDQISPGLKQAILKGKEL
jgi:predicted nucleotidyltransferase